MAHSYHCVNPLAWLNAIMVERKPQDQDKFVLRLPDGMRERIKFVAERNKRSMNAEIIATLEEKYPYITQDQADEMMALLIRYFEIKKPTNISSENYAVIRRDLTEYFRAFLPKKE